MESLEEEKAQTRISSMLQYVNDSQWKASAEAKEVLKCIRKIPGDKVITVNVDSVFEIFDVLKNGNVGSEKEHENIFLKRVDAAFKKRNSFMIRQFIPNSDELVMNDGKQALMQKKAIYSFMLKDGGIIPMPEKEVEYAMTHDANGRPHIPEDLLVYKNFKEFLGG